MPGQEQGPGGALAESAGKKRRTAHLCGDDPVEFIGVEEKQISAGWFVVHKRHSQHDAVIGGHGRAVQAVAFVQACGYGQRPRGVDRHAEGAVQYHPPVAEFVVEAFYHQGFVVGDVAGGGLLLVQVAE